jgi:hypothetical protein
VYIHVDLSAPPASPQLRDPDTFTEFKVVVANADDHRDAVWSAAARVGRVGDAEHVFVDAGILERLAGGRVQDEAWRRGFTAMIAFAEEHGWIGEEGAVRAHVELE